MKTTFLIAFTVLFLHKNVEADSIPDFKPDTITFKKNSVKLDSTLYSHLDILASEINKFPNRDFAVRTYGSTDKSNQISYDRGVKIITYLTNKRNVNRERLILYYGLKGDPDMVVIRFAFGEETGGTRCGFPLYPDLKK